MNSPFKFLDSYDKSDKDQFFGRDKEIAQLYNTVHASNLILLYGGSGTGKTSLINCGLANQFHDTDWLPIFIRRGNNLNRSITREINKQMPQGVGVEGMALRHKIKELYLEKYRPIYLIFDQFEELYIMGDKEEQDTFHKAVAELLQSGVQCKILLSIREEYIAFLSEFEKVVLPLFDNRLRIERMSDRNLAKVVSGTAKYHNVDIQEPRTTIPAILNNLRSKRERVDLTNLQVYLDRLWRKDVERQGGGRVNQVRFDPQLVSQVGPMQNVLSEFLDEQMELVERGLKQRGISKPDGIPLEILFTLVTEDGTKRNMDVAEIMEDLPKNRRLSEEDIAWCMEQFQEIKLLRRFAQE